VVLYTRRLATPFRVEGFHLQSLAYLARRTDCPGLSSISYDREFGKKYDGNFALYKNAPLWDEWGFIFEGYLVSVPVYCLRLINLIYKPR
jgi:hypothetical protein